MADFTRRAALTALGVLGAGSVLGVGYVLRGIVESSTRGTSLADGGMMGGGMMGMEETPTVRARGCAGG
jgi:hypothetical protein